MNLCRISFPVFLIRVHFHMQPTVLEKNQKNIEKLPSAWGFSPKKGGQGGQFSWRSLEFEIV